MLMGGGGGLAICGGVGGWRKRRRGYDDGVGWCWTVSLWASPSLRAPPFVVAAHRTAVPYPRSPACDWNADCDGASAPLPQHQIPQNTVRTHIGKRPTDGASNRVGRGNRWTHKLWTGVSIAAGGGGVGQRVAQAGHGGNTPLTPQLWPVELEAEADLITPTDPGRRYAQGGRSYLEDRGALCAQPFHGGWGRLGAAGGIKGQERKLRTVQGGCTLSLPRVYSQSCMDQTAPITIETATLGLGSVDGTGGESHINNILEENFQCEFESESTGRQAQALPQNLEAWCPGSLLTNLADLHHRARSARPTSAAELLRMRSWLDHPRSHCSRFEETPPERTGPGARRNLEAARAIASRFFER